VIEFRVRNVVSNPIYLEPVRKLLGGAFGLAALVFGAGILCAGIAGLLYGLFVLAYGGMHNSRLEAVIFLPIGLVFTPVDYGLIRLGWSTLGSSKNVER
jgi:hypothetical protein